LTLWTLFLSSMADPLTSTLRPVTDSLLVVRVIKSFSYRVVKNLVLPHIDLTATTIGDLKKRVNEEIQKHPGFKAFRKADFDTMKIYVKAHESKTQNLIINLENDDWIMNDDQTLEASGCENETTLSIYNRADYEAFKLNPEEKWM